MKRNIDHFLHEWLTIADTDQVISDDLEHQAQALGVDLHQAYYAIIIKHSEQVLPVTHIQLALRLDATHQIYILRQFEAPTLVTQYFAAPNQIGIGSPHFDVIRTIQEALQALCFTTISPLQHQATYQTTQQFELLRHGLMANKQLIATMHNLGNGTDELNLLNTFWFFTLTNHNVAKTAQILHVHRKTVEYRLKRFTAITQYNPQHVIENIDLLAAYVTWRTRDLPLQLAKLARITNHMLPQDSQLPDI